MLVLMVLGSINKDNFKTLTTVLLEFISVMDKVGIII